MSSVYRPSTSFRGLLRFPIILFLAALGTAPSWAAGDPPAHAAVPVSARAVSSPAAPRPAASALSVLAPTEANFQQTFAVQVNFPQPVPAQTARLYLLNDQLDANAPVTLKGSLEAAVINGTAVFPAVELAGGPATPSSVRLAAVVVVGSETLSGVSQPIAFHPAPPPPVSLRDEIFGGIGVDLVLRDGILTVFKAMDDLPADKAGVEDDDQIVSVDGKPTAGLDLDGASQLLSGPPGSTALLQLRKDSHDQPRSISVTRMAMVRSPVEVDWVADQNDSVPFQMTVKVLDDNKNPLPGATVTIQVDPEYGKAHALFFSSKVQLQGGSGAAFDSLTSETGADGTATLWVRLSANISPFDTRLLATAQWGQAQSNPSKSNVFSVYSLDTGSN